MMANHGNPLERVGRASRVFLEHETAGGDRIPLLTAPADRTLNSWCIVGTGERGIARIASAIDASGRVAVVQGTARQPMPPGMRQAPWSDAVIVNAADVLVLI